MPQARCGPSSIPSFTFLLIHGPQLQVARHAGTDAGKLITQSRRRFRQHGFNFVDVDVVALCNCQIEFGLKCLGFDQAGCLSPALARVCACLLERI